MRLDPSFLNIPLTHRGLHDRAKGVVENSRDAFDAAITHGYGIECDIQFTKDNKPVMFHDYVLKRLTGRMGAVKDLTLAEMMHVPLLDSQNCPQSLPDLLAQVDGKVPLLIEIKDPSLNFQAPAPEHIDVIVKEIQAYDGPIALMSFNPEFMRELRKALPNVALGRTTDDFTLPTWSFMSNAVIERANIIEPEDFDFISHNCANIERVANLNLPKLSWTIKSPEQETEARCIADNITFEGYLAPHDA